MSARFHTHKTLDFSSNVWHELHTTFTKGRPLEKNFNEVVLEFAKQQGVDEELALQRLRSHVEKSRLIAPPLDVRIPSAVRPATSEDVREFPRITLPALVIEVRGAPRRYVFPFRYKKNGQEVLDLHLVTVNFFIHDDERYEDTPPR